MNNTDCLRDEIITSILEAKLMENAHLETNPDRVFFNAQRLSLAPASFIREVIEKERIDIRC